MKGRPINKHEVALVAALLSPELQGFMALRDQIPSANVVPGCECGCGTIDFIFDDHGADLPRSTSTSPTPWSPEIFDGHGEVVGSLILFLRDGLLQSLEVVSYLDPLPLPQLDRVNWTSAP